MSCEENFQLLRNKYQIECPDKCDEAEMKYKTIKS